MKTLRRARAMLRGDADAVDRRAGRGCAEVESMYYCCPRCEYPIDGVRGEESVCEHCGMVTRRPRVKVAR